MKLHYFLLLFLVLNFEGKVNAQFRYGDELKDVDFKILSSREGHLYSGIDNYIQVSSETITNLEGIYIESTNGDIFADSGQIYLLIPTRPGKVRLTLYSITGKDTTILGYKNFPVKRVPEPQLIVGNTLVNVVDTLMKRTLLDCDSLIVYFSYDIIGSEHWLKISEFLIGYNYGGFHVSHLNQSCILNDKTKQLITYMAPDREISIKLTVESEGKVYQELPIYKITIY